MLTPRRDDHFEMSDMHFSTSRRRGRHHRRRRSSSSSSSGSSDSAAAKKLKKAERVLLKADPSYRAFKKDQEAELERDRLKEQGRILAGALSSSFEAALAAAQAQVAPGVASFPPPQPSSGSIGPVLPVPPVLPGGPSPGGPSVLTPVSSDEDAPLSRLP